MRRLLSSSFLPLVLRHNRWISSVETSWLLPAACALAPGVYTWWDGRRVAARADDPELPELLMAHRQRVIRSWAFGGPILALLVPGAGWEWVPLLVLGLMIGGFPLRRGLYAEPWGLGAYLLWTARTGFVNLGIALLLLFTPLAVVRAQPYHWVAAAAAVAVLQLWRRFQFRLWRWAYRARPLDHPALAERFGEIMRRAGGGVSPTLYRMGPRGGRLANAFALPEPGRPAVAFGQDLLDLLDEDDAAAIFAHELGHLEQFDAARIRRQRMRMHGVVALTVGLPLALVAVGQGGVWQALLAGSAMVFAFAFAQGGARQAQADETAADRRAAELTGDPELLVGALVRLHQYARLPRRWPHDMEAGASHPSLARRIAALRGDAAPAPVPGVVASPREGSWVAFEPARVSWMEGVPAGTTPEPAALQQAAATVRTVAYAELADLRVRVGDGGQPVLQATDRAGASWAFPLFPQDVDAVRERVHAVDAHFAAPAPIPSVLPRRVVAVAALLASGWAAAPGILIAVLLALVWPATPVMAALGAMALGSVGVRVAEGALRWSGPVQITLLAVLAVVGVAALALSFAQGERRGAPRRPGVPLAVLGLVAALALARMALLWREGSVDWRVGEPGAVTLGLLLLGVAAGLLRLPRSTARRGGAAAAGALGLAALVLALGVDRFDRATPRIRWAQGRAAAAGSVALPGVVELVAVSPSGRAYLVRRPADPSAGWGEDRWRYQVGDFAGFRRDVTATEAAFASDDRLVVVRAEGDSAEVRMEPVAADTTLWRHTVRGILRPTVTADAGGGWTLLGLEPDVMTRILVSGGPAGPLRTRRGKGGEFGPTFGLADATLVQLRPEIPDSDTRFVLPWILGFGAFLRWEAWRVDALGEFPLGRMRGMPSCAGPDERGGVVCEVVDGRRAQLWSFGRDGGMVRVGEVPSDLFQMNLRDGVLAAVRPGEVAVIRPEARRGWRVRLPGDDDYPSAAHPVPGGLVMVYAGMGNTTIRRFRTTLPAR
jgi:Zn-dependent protease with chaperone function